jgi:putative oxidoreductase
MNASIASLIARITMAALFLPAGISKITGYAGTSGYMDSQGVPGILLPLVILVEVGGGLALLAGFQTRLVSWGLALFTLLAAILFHRNFGDAAMGMVNQIMFFKNIAIAGGLVALSALGGGEYSVDGRKG